MRTLGIEPMLQAAEPGRHAPRGRTIPHRWLRPLLVAVMLWLVVMAVTETREARAYSAGVSGTKQLQAVNWDLGLPVYKWFNWTATATSTYSRVNPGGANPYTRVTAHAHNVKTNNSELTMYGLTGTATSWFYNGFSLNIANLYNYFGRCAIPYWVFWLCGAGSTDIAIQPNPATLTFRGTLTTTPPWYPMAGGEYNGSITFS